MQLTTIRKTKLVNIASSAKNILDGFVQIFGSQGVTLSLPTLIVLVHFFCCMQILKALSLHFEVVSPCYTFLTAENENRSISGRFATGRFWRSI